MARQRANQPLVRTPVLGVGLVREHVTLCDVTSLRTGGVADLYGLASNIQEIRDLVQLADERDLPILFFGTGRHAVISDFGFSGLVIQNAAQSITAVRETGQMMVESGARWHEIVLAAAHAGLGGLEGFVGELGTVGGSLAVRLQLEDISAWSLVRSLTLLDPTGQIWRLDRQQRPHEIDLTDQIILSVTLQCTQLRNDEIMRRLQDRLRRLRRYERQGLIWLGPIFHFSKEADHSVSFSRAGLYGLRGAGVSFSRERPNYLAIQGRTTSRELRQLISRGADRLSQIPIEPFSIQIAFMGHWDGVDRTLAALASSI